jgi:two-component system cell cycle response regulator/two-component system cell cycle response regulator DivK
VLIVEDDPTSARVLLAELDLKGCELRVAHSAEEALAILQLFPAQAIVADLVLPGMSGLLLARLVTTDPAHRETVIVAVSFLDGAGTERLAVESGCVAYLHKPVDVEKLARVIARHVKTRTRNA